MNGQSSLIQGRLRLLQINLLYHFKDTASINSKLVVLLTLPALQLALIGVSLPKIKERNRVEVTEGLTRYLRV